MRTNSSSIRIRTLKTFVFLLLLVTFGAGSLDYIHAADAKPVSKATFAGGCFWCMQPAFRPTAGRHLDDGRLHRRAESESHL